MCQAERLPDGFASRMDGFVRLNIKPRFSNLRQTVSAYFRRLPVCSVRASCCSLPCAAPCNASIPAVVYSHPSAVNSNLHSACSFAKGLQGKIFG